MIESEAKTKWCCANMSFPIEVTVGFQADPIIELTQKCQGSACMAWRETDNEFPPSNATNVNHPLDTGLPAGYCGLAGK